MVSIEYDLLNWSSFPSSLKLTNETDQQIWHNIVDGIPVNADLGILKMTFKGKGKDLIIHPTTQLGTSHVIIEGLSEQGSFIKRLTTTNFPEGTFVWNEFSEVLKVPTTIKKIRVIIIAGPGLSIEQPSMTWIDDLLVYLNDRLIYETHFTSYRPAKFVPLIINPPEIIVKRWQQRKAKVVTGK